MFNLLYHWHDGFIFINKTFTVNQVVVGDFIRSNYLTGLCMKLFNACGRTCVERCSRLSDLFLTDAWLD